MMAELLCQTDSYIQEFNATVVAIDQATSAVGHIRVVDYQSKGKINKRIYIALEA
jgi:Ser-tRNA(Ala) deacylase AlaX